jgi:DNA-binding Xre family transcriptional regulator
MWSGRKATKVNQLDELRAVEERLTALLRQGRGTVKDLRNAIRETQNTLHVLVEDEVRNLILETVTRQCEELAKAQSEQLSRAIGVETNIVRILEGIRDDLVRLAEDPHIGRKLAAIGMLANNVDAGRIAEVSEHIKKERLAGAQPERPSQQERQSGQARRRRR